MKAQKWLKFRLLALNVHSRGDTHNTLHSPRAFHQFDVKIRGKGKQWARFFATKSGKWTCATFRNEVVNCLSGQEFRKLKGFRVEAEKMGAEENIWRENAGQILLLILLLGTIGGLSPVFDLITRRGQIKKGGWISCRTIYDSLAHKQVPSVQFGSVWVAILVLSKFFFN